MREILFRGKTINSGKWIEGYLFENWGDAYICLGTENGNIMKEKVNEVTAGQYTGIEDANGKKIFEGDIVEFLDWKPKEVVWGNKIDKALSGCCGYMLDGTMHFLGENETYLIIGNIHDNPELVKEELK